MSSFVEFNKLSVQSVFDVVRASAEKRCSESSQHALRSETNRNLSSPIVLTHAQLKLAFSDTADVSDQVNFMVCDESANDHMSDYASRFHYVNGGFVHSYHLRRYEMVCLHCLAEGVRSKPEWQFGWMPFCVQHGCLLMELTSHQDRMLCDGSERLKPLLPKKTLEDTVARPYQYTLELTVSDDDGQYSDDEVSVRVGSDLIALQNRIRNLVCDGKEAFILSKEKLDLVTTVLKQELGITDSGRPKNARPVYYRFDTVRTIRVMRKIVRVLEINQGPNNGHNTAQA